MSRHQQQQQRVYCLLQNRKEWAWQENTDAVFSGCDDERTPQGTWVQSRGNFGKGGCIVNGVHLKRVLYTIGERLKTANYDKENQA